MLALNANANVLRKAVAGCCGKGIAMDHDKGLPSFLEAMQSSQTQDSQPPQPDLDPTHHSLSFQLPVIDTVTISSQICLAEKLIQLGQM